MRRYAPTGVLLFLAAGQGGLAKYHRQGHHTAASTLVAHEAAYRASLKVASKDGGLANLDAAGQKMVQSLMKAPGVDSSAATASSIRTAVEWMQKAGILACPSVTSALGVENVPAATSDATTSETQPEPAVPATSAPTEALKVVVAAVSAGSHHHAMSSVLETADSEGKDEVKIEVSDLPLDRSVMKSYAKRNPFQAR